MISATLNLWGNGAVTLPKEWRDRYGTRHFMAKENESGYLVIMPILDTEYYEEADGSFGLRFPSGIEAGELIRLWKQGMKEVEKKEKGTKKTRSVPRKK